MDTLFSDEQKRCLIESWRRDDFDWLYDIGIRVYSRIFELAPSAKQLFPYVVQYEAEGRNFRESKEFQNQALRFVQALGKGVLSLEDDREKIEFDQYLYNLGHAHKKWENRGFMPDYWNIFEIAVAQVMAEETAKADRAGREGGEKIEELYAIMSNYMILRMKEGFYDISPTPYKPQV